MTKKDVRPVCEWCGRQLEPAGRRGRLPRYCCRSHRQRAYEARRAAGATSSRDLFALEKAVAALRTELADPAALGDVLAAYRRVADAAAELLGRPLPAPPGRSGTSSPHQSVTVTTSGPTPGRDEPSRGAPVDVRCSAETVRSGFCGKQARWVAGRPGTGQYLCGRHAKQYERRGVQVRMLDRSRWRSGSTGSRPVQVRITLPGLSPAQVAMAAACGAETTKTTATFTGEPAAIREGLRRAAETKPVRTRRLTAETLADRFEQAARAGNAPETPAKAHCGQCSRLIGTHPGVYWSVPDARGRRQAYVYLRHHNDRTGRRCPGGSAALLQAT